MRSTLRSKFHTHLTNMSCTSCEADCLANLICPQRVTAWWVRDDGAVQQHEMHKSILASTSMLLRRRQHENERLRCGKLCTSCYQQPMSHKTLLLVSKGAFIMRETIAIASSSV